MGGLSTIMPQKILSVIRQCQKDHSGDKRAVGPNLLSLCLRKLQHFPFETQIQFCHYAAQQCTHIKMSHAIPLYHCLKPFNVFSLFTLQNLKSLMTPQDLTYPSRLISTQMPCSLYSSHTYLLWVPQWNTQPLISGKMTQESSHLPFPTITLATWHYVSSLHWNITLKANWTSSKWGNKIHRKMLWEIMVGKFKCVRFSEDKKDWVQWR